MKSKLKGLWIGLLIVVITITTVQVAKKYFYASGGSLSGKAKGRTMGAVGAPVTIIAYSDFQCGGCAQAQSILKKFESKYKGEIRIAFEHFPLRSHQWAMLAHQAAECANQNGQFWAMHDKLFENQRDWMLAKEPALIFLSYAKELGLSVDAFATCLTDPKITDIVLKDKERGKKLQINATPSFFVQDRRVVGATALKNQGEEIILEVLASHKTE